MVVENNGARYKCELLSGVGWDLGKQIWTTFLKPTSSAVHLTPPFFFWNGLGRNDTAMSSPSCAPTGMRTAAWTRPFVVEIVVVIAPVETLTLISDRATKAVTDCRVLVSDVNVS